MGGDAARVLTLGVGDAFSRQHYSTSLLLEHAGQRLLIEAPHPLAKMLHEASQGSLAVDNLDAVFISHLHPDHASGLELLGYDLRQRLNRRLPLLASRAVIAGLQSTTWADRLFELREVDASSGREIPGFALSIRPTGHPVPTAALRVQAGERSLAFSADTPFDRALIDWLGGADLLLHEVGPPPGHSDLEQLRALPAVLRARLRLVHVPDALLGATAPLICLPQGRWSPI